MFKGYRTVIFNVIMTGAMILSTTGVIGADVEVDADSVNVFLDNLEGVLTVVWGVGNLFLRKITTGPIGTKR